MNAQPPYGDIAIGLLFLLVGAGATWWVFGLPANYLTAAVGIYGLAGALVLTVRSGRGGVGKPTSSSARPSGELGAANRVTLGRAILVMLVAALASVPEAPTSPALYWWVIVVSTLAMSLDGVDGRIARRSGTTSAFGARFDMELDAFLLLALSVLVWESGKVGAWVLLIGGLRYLFIAVGWVWPALRGKLPESQRRKTVCVVQGVALLVCLGPIIPEWMAVAAAAVALSLLVYSFAVDIWWLASRPTEVERTLPTA